MSRPVLLDLYCGQGGAGMGYHRAGFDVLGVDINPQPRYPFAFHRGDALDVLDWLTGGAPIAFTTKEWRRREVGLDKIAATHASPPCQDHSVLHAVSGDHGTGWLLGATFEALGRIGRPWVIENVPGAPMPGAVTLCGASLGCGALVGGREVILRRHRRFATSFPVPMVPPCACGGRRKIVGVYGGGGTNKAQARTLGYRSRALSGKGTAQASREAMGINWMDREGLDQAVPPVYTQYIGEQMLAAGQVRP